MMEEKVYNFINDYHNVSFAEIVDKFGDGDQVLRVKGNLILWHGLGAATAEAIINLVNKKQIEWETTSVMRYAIDGTLLKLPLAKRVPKNGYKTPHWVPVVLRVVD